jgi:hypothetical protein
MLIEIARYFIDFLTTSIQPCRATAEHGRTGPPVFSENLQALAIPLRSPRAAFNIVVLLFCHSHERFNR